VPADAVQGAGGDVDVEFHRLEVKEVGECAKLSHILN
jgi:hypothetical protein